jgi:hypothetical protein
MLMRINNNWVTDLRKAEVNRGYFVVENDASLGHALDRIQFALEVGDPHNQVWLRDCQYESLSLVDINV